MANADHPTSKREFHCVHCNGRILIPWDLPPTTGPCPLCGGVITSPPPPVTVVPAPASPVAGPTKVLVDTSRARPLEPAAVETAAERGRSGLLPVLLVLLGLIWCGGLAVYFMTREMGREVPAPAAGQAAGELSAREASYIRIGWQKDAYQVLGSFIAGTSAQDKLPHIIDGEALAEKVDDFYGGGVINDSDTPAEAFSVYELSEEDRRRGIFMMTYDRPPQFSMREFFRPLAPLEVQYGIDEADVLLSTVARAGNFAMEPLRVHAFFKRAPQGLKLDWEVFAQTKYRTFQNFVELPEVGHSGAFRVFIVEDVPHKSRGGPGTRTYRMADPANTGDTARVVVKVDSDVGRELAVINWRGAQDARPITRTATVELRWGGEDDAPVLEMSRFICWEFLGLGGGNQAAAANR